MITKAWFMHSGENVACSLTAYCCGYISSQVLRWILCKRINKKLISDFTTDFCQQQEICCIFMPYKIQVILVFTAQNSWVY